MEQARSKTERRRRSNFNVTSTLVFYYFGIF